MKGSTTAEPLRVAHLMPFPVEYFVPLYRELASRPEIDLTVFYFSDATTGEFFDPQFGQKIKWDIPLLDGYRSMFLPSASRAGISGGFFAWRNWDVVREVASGRYDVLWAHGYAHLTTWLATFGARTRGTRLLLRDAQNLIQPRPWSRRVLKRVAVRLLYRQAYGAYVGEEARRYFEHYGMPTERLFIARHCVDNRFFQEAGAALAERRDDVRRSFGIEDDAPVFVFCGKFVEHKQPVELVEAFDRVRREHPCWLLLVGDGELRPVLEELVAGRGTPGVRFAGFLNQTEIPAAYAAADVFVLPSSVEVWGMVVNEAMNFSLPLILSDKVGASADLLRPGWNGFSFPSGDVEALAEAMRSLAAGAAIRARFGARSRELVEEYSVERAADELIEALFAASPGSSGGRQTTAGAI